MFKGTQKLLESCCFLYLFSKELKFCWLRCENCSNDESIGGICVLLKKDCHRIWDKNLEMKRITAKFVLNAPLRIKKMHLYSDSNEFYQSDWVFSTLTSLSISHGSTDMIQKKNNIKVNDSLSAVLVYK